MSPDVLRDLQADAEQFPDWVAWLCVVGLVVIVWLMLSDWFRRLR